MSNKLHQALGDWRSSATNVKAKIYTETIEGKKKKKRLPIYIKLASATAVLTVGVTGAILMTNEPTPAPVPANENNEEQNEEQKTTFRPINENFLKISQYEEFYRDFSFNTQKGATFNALSNGVRYYALFNHLAEHGLSWDEKKRETFRRSLESQLAHDLMDPDFAAYFEKLQADLSITKDQYIEDYLLVVKEQEMLESEMFRTGVGTVDGAYETSLVEEAFQQKMGISFDYIEYLAISINEHLTPLDPQPKLSFNKDPDEPYHAQITKNLNGEYIFVNANPTPIDLPMYLSEYIYQLKRAYHIPDLTRLTFRQFKAAVEEEATKGIEMAQQVLDFLIIFERTVEWDFTFQPYNYNDIPNFEKDVLRVHNDLTLRIAEYELYHKSKELYEPQVAYRYANELVGNMYGLFNYLAQDYDYGWSPETRAQKRAEVTQELETTMQNDLEKAYIEKLLADLNISLEDYVNYYVLLKKEYEMLQESMVKNQVGVDINGRYNRGEQSSRYRETIGFTWKNLYDTMDAKSITPAYKELETQPELPFTLHPTLKFTVLLDENGEYVLQYPTIFEICLTDEQSELYLNIQEKHNLPPLSRYSVQAYIAQTQLLSTKTAKELVEIFTLLDRTIN